MAAGGDQRVHQLVAVRERAARRPCRRRASASSSASALAGVSRPTAIPTVACLVGKLVSSSATRAASAPAGGAAARGVAPDGRRARSARDRRRSAAPATPTGESSRVAFLERDHPAEQPAVELRDRDLGRRVERRQARSRVLPPARDAGRADRLDDRHVERGERRRVPLLPLLADASPARRAASAAPEPPVASIVTTQRVDVAVEQLERRHAPVGVAAQRVAPDRQRVGAGLVERVAERVDERRVAGQAVRAVEADADRRARGSWAASARRARRRRRRGRRRRGRRPRAAARSRGPRAGTCRRGSAAAARRCRRRRGAGTRPPGRPLPPGPVDSAVISASGSASPPSASSAIPRSPAALAQQVDAVGPAAAAAEDPAQHDARAVEQIVDEERARRACPRGWRSAPPGSPPAGAPRPLPS